MLHLIQHDGKTIGAIDAPESMGPLEWFARNTNHSMAYALEHDGYAVQAVDEIDCHNVADIIEAICARSGVTMTAVFVPFSQSRNAKPGADGKTWRSLNWKVTIARNRHSLTTDYAQGEAHAPAYKAKMLGGGKASATYTNRLRSAAIAQEIETGRVHVFGDGPLVAYNAMHDTRKPILAPRLGDVMHSLVRDSDVLDLAGFEDWAANYGYDTDSKSAEAIYRACIEIALQLRAMLGDSLLTELRTVAAYN